MWLIMHYLAKVVFIKQLLFALKAHNAKLSYIRVDQSDKVSVNNRLAYETSHALDTTLQNCIILSNKLCKMCYQECFKQISLHTTAQAIVYILLKLSHFKLRNHTLSLKVLLSSKAPTAVEVTCSERMISLR